MTRGPMILLKVARMSKVATFLMIFIGLTFSAALTFYAFVLMVKWADYLFDRFNNSLLVGFLMPLPLLFIASLAISWLVF